MITYVNTSNASKYSVLFANATQDLIEAQIAYDENGIGSDLGYKYKVDEDNKPVLGDDNLYIAEDPINTIERYFQYLPKLVELGDANSSESYKVLHSLGRRYTMLPIDEDTFVIDADKRTITIPSSFSSNGVAVQGDQLAEILYFEIDRYFDAKDLDDADIFIQWRAPTADGKTLDGLSAPIVVDIQSKPNKIIFGWALTDVITAGTGTIQFAVRFFKWENKDEGTLSYSLATQTASIKVNSTLNFTLSSSTLQQMARDMDAENTLLINRIKNAQTYVTDNEDAQFPVYILNLSDDENMSTPTTDEDGHTVVYVDLLNVDSDGVETYTLKTQARSQDSGTITYNWNYESILPGDDTTASGAQVGSTSDPSNSEVSISFELTEDETVDSDKIYYQAVANGALTAYKPFATSELGDETPKSAGLYERIATCKVKQVGKFFATATNTKAKANAKSLDSDICIVPMPTQPTITTDLEERKTLKEAAGESITLTVVAANDETNGTHNGTLSYQWYMKNNDDANPDDNTVGEYKEIENATNATLTLTYDSDADAKDIEGFYQVIVKNHKNDQNVTVTSAACRVSYVASAPILSFPMTSDDTQVDFSSADKTLKVELQKVWSDNWNISDKIEYQWYTTKDDTIGNTDVDTEETMIEGATSATYVPTKQGKYYCNVTNVKNGTEASKPSLVFYVV